MTNRDFDLILFGATGFTGRLVAEQLNGHGSRCPSFRWAIAGRSRAKLEALRDELCLSADFPLVLASTDDTASFDAMVRSARLCLSTVGPYQLHGAGLVAACARAGTDYVDLCGETAWMRDMIDAHSDDAKATGARLLFSCGFDSIPSELGVMAVQALALEQGGGPIERLRCRVVSMVGSFSGGTLASMRANMAAARDPQIAARLADPFVLTPGFTGAPQPAGDKPDFDDELGLWLAPFFMAPINTRNVHRSNFLQGHPFGTDFVYDEMMIAGAGDQGRAIAEAITKSFESPPVEGGPKSGEGPSLAERDAGSYKLAFAGRGGMGAATSASSPGIETRDMDQRRRSLRRQRSLYSTIAISAVVF